MRKVIVVLTEGYSDWECGQFLASARTDFKFEVLTASPNGSMVTSAGGLKTLVDMSLDNVDPSKTDCLVFCGGPIWESESAPDTRQLLHSLSKTNSILGAICGGTLALARAGLLDEIPHTSNELAYLSAIEDYRGHAFYQNVPHAVRSERIVTAPGSAPITFTAELYRAMGFGGTDLDEYVTLFGREFPR